MGNRYTITDRVDSGGMAEVFRGVAESLQGFKKNVAIKRILPSLTRNKKFVAMFLDEARLSLFLQHANIVQVFDIGQTENSYFLVMEFVDGCNLKNLLDRLKQKGKRLEVAHAIYLMLEACKGLTYAHHVENPETNEPLHLVHRDISPPNILISKNGEVKLVDFGLAKANSQIESTDPGVVKGKFSYLSPEAASGREVDQRADIFAVGILLWEMFTGRRLFYGDTDYQTVELVRQARIPSIAAINPEIDPKLEAIVRKALARDPDDRYTEAADLGDALAQFLFSHRMKVTARDISLIVRDVQTETLRRRSLVPQESLIDSLIKEEMGRVTSLIDDDEDSPTIGEPGGASSLDPSAFLDAGWPAEEATAQDPVPAIATATSGSLPALAPAARRSASLAAAAPPPPGPALVPDTSADLESLQQMLEPDRTGVHARTSRHGLALLVIAVVVALALGGAALMLALG